MSFKLHVISIVVSKQLRFTLLCDVSYIVFELVVIV